MNANFQKVNKSISGKLVAKLVVGEKKITAGNYVDEIGGIYKIGENQYKVCKVECGKVVAEIQETFTAKDFLKIGRESAYSASKAGFVQCKLK